MSERERLINLLEDALGCPRKSTESLADYLIKNGVVVLPVSVGFPCRIRKFITNSEGKLERIEVEDAVVSDVCVLTENKSGKQIMMLSNVFPISGE